MDNNKNHQKSIPFIDVSRSTAANHLSSYISVSSSEESLPIDAPLVRQPRCSVDIDTISINISEKSFTDEIASRTHSNLDSPDLQESIRDYIEWVYKREFKTWCNRH